VRIAALMSFIGALVVSTGAVCEEPCNPILEGTYCATQMPKKRDTSSGTGQRLQPLSDMSRMVPSSSVSGPPATLFGLSFQGSSSCVGLFRRSTCD
jgi:hypothetical protein